MGGLDFVFEQSSPHRLLPLAKGQLLGQVVECRVFVRSYL